MKKIISVALVLVMVLVCSVSAFAATKEQVMNALSKPVITEYWDTRTIPAEYLNAAEKHLDKANFTAAELDEILAYINEGRFLLEEEYGEVYFKKLTPAQQTKMLDLVKKAAKAAKVEVTIKDNKVSFKSLLTDETVGGTVSKPIQNTGADVTALAVAASALVLAAVAGTVVAKKNGLGK